MNRLGTKAETLAQIYQKLNYAKVLPQFTFTVDEWRHSQERIRKEFSAFEWHESVIVRSSSLSEDTQQSSEAGKYESVADVSGEEAFQKAAETVIASYDDDNTANQVLVQPMLSDVRICGVAFTLDPNTMGNYYVINYDDHGSTSAITSGQGTRNKLYYRFKESENEQIQKQPEEMNRLCQALHELELFFGQDNLDVEFAFAGKELYILQVRSLCVQRVKADIEAQKRELELIRRKIRQEQCEKPFLCGKTTVYSVMTDWNPAEMIGIRPKPLALSLYREIITDNVWAYQRDNYGYRNLRSFPLMVDFAGLPYIDVRVSFNSFVPAELNEELSEKLVNYYLNCLIENPQKHDKAEFDIVFSCYTLDLPERIQILKKYEFTDDEIEEITDALRNVTNHIIDHEDGLWRKDYAKIKTLNQRYDEVMKSGLSDLEKVYWLLEDCKRYGTLPFAGLARGAFIAVQILQSLVTCGIITKQDYDRFMNGVNTVSSDMKADFKELSRDAFLKKYGHLRPGTYDITSQRYDEAPDLYFAWNIPAEEAGKNESEEKEEFRLSLQQLNQLKQKLLENGLVNDILDLMDFIKTVIEGREYGKFAFTRNLSKAMELIVKIGKERGIDREDCAFLNVRTIYDLYSSTRDIKTEYLHSIQQGKVFYQITQSVTLPPVITEADDVMRFYYPDSEPNYITSGRTTGEVCYLGKTEDVSDLKGKIILIPSADPGYDWVFSRGISGLVTMYGGANSHMAIRAGELGIPAAVGVGEKQFARYKDAMYIEIDASGKMIKTLR